MHTHTHTHTRTHICTHARRCMLAYKSGNGQSHAHTHVHIRTHARTLSHWHPSLIGVSHTNSTYRAHAHSTRTYTTHANIHTLLRILHFNAHMSYKGSDDDIGTRTRAKHAQRNTLHIRIHTVSMYTNINDTHAYIRTCTCVPFLTAFTCFLLLPLVFQLYCFHHQHLHQQV